jgi:hypothetical protein
MARIDLSDEALAAGCSNTPAGAHTGKTMMLADIRRLLEAVPPSAKRDQYVRAIVEENALEKPTAATRTFTLWVIRRLYGLDPTVAVFAVMRELWALEFAAQPTLAMLCVVARDPILRATAAYVLGVQEGEPLARERFSSDVGEAYPGRHTPGVLEHIGQNIASTWTQAGLLRGTRIKTRSHPPLTIPGLVYALYLGHVEGLTGPALLTSLWAHLLDAPEAALRAQLAQAARAGWIDLAASGGMTEIGFSHLDNLVTTGVK